MTWIPEVIELARLNKVLLHILRASNYDGELRSSQEDGLRRIVNVVAEVEDALGGIEHALIKLVKPVTYVPTDVDVLVRRDQVLLAASRLVRLGYRVLLYEPYTITLVKNGINVDLYVHPSAANLIYARGEDFLKSRVKLGITVLMCSVLIGTVRLSSRCYMPCIRRAL